MTITAVYNTAGEAVFSFPSRLYSSDNSFKSASNTKYNKTSMRFAPFNLNDIVVYQGDESGYYLTVTHQDEPVLVLNSFLSIDDLQFFLDESRSECGRLNRSLATNDVFFSYFLIEHKRNYCNPASPSFHFLVKYVESIEQFYLLFDCYESLYEKRAEYDKNKDLASLTGPFLMSLTQDEMNVMAFSIFSNSGDTFLCDASQKSLLNAVPDLKNGAFEKFGIHDQLIDNLFRALKMHPYFFIYKIKNKEAPSVYYYSDSLGSYLEPDDELMLWRKGGAFRDFLASNYEQINSIAGQDDRP